MISDMLGGSGTITAIDAVRHRLAACRTMLLKYSCTDCCRLFFADGTNFSLPPLPSHIHQESCKHYNLLFVSSPDELCPLTCLTVVGLTKSEGLTEVFMEWSSKRTWKERKVAKNSKKTSLASPDEEPELIFYGNSAGVVGRSKEEVYLIKDHSEMSISGYDKV